MDYSEKWGTDVNTAVQLALDDLKLTIDEVDVTVLEEPSRGFFGIGSKLALVRVEKKKELKEQERREEEALRTEETAAKPQRQREERSAAPKNRRERSGKQVRKENSRKEKETVEFVEPVIARIPEDQLKPCEDHPALHFLEEVTKQMGLNLDISAKEGEEALYIDIQGKDSGTIIGKRGQTLDAIQYLTSLVVNKNQDKYTRVVVDAENYRAKREKTLEMLAIRLANKVSKTGKSVKLEPMNPYERKVIHATLQNHPYVTTKSEGQDPYRRVIIELK